MSDATPLLSLPLILPAQAQKHVTHNEALRLLDILLHLAVLDRDRSAAPALPGEGDRHIVAPGATGAWAGQSGKVAAFWDGVWVFLDPRAGWQARVLAEDLALCHDGTTWQPAFTAPEMQPRLGIATAPDATNRLAVASPASLFTHAGQGHQVKLNKATPGDTASFLFQTGWSGRAEIGLVGEDAFSLKVSADGTAFQPVLTADPATGRATIARPMVLQDQGTPPAALPDGALWHADGQLSARLAGQTLRLDGQGHIPVLTPPSGELILSTTGAGGTTTSTVAGSAGRFDIFPFLPRADLTLDRLLVNCTAAVAGALARIAIYAADAQGRPETLILETDDLDLGTVGAKSATVSLALRQGRTVWLGLRHSATATLSTWAPTATPDLNGGTAPATTARKVLRRSVAWSSPAPALWGWNAAEISSANATAIWLRQA
ncbi:DUF2793 domain-containing protein [Tabrizicola sp. TH137]|uniref:DUF2793 domain-containing protein n=1 Tax=Tabrizicola sp. TH137 TaxID=2067452 RepID=UPI00117F9D3C|nr:DUF2793 domain-containing protein [Tabrizicola sp. TH137]